MRNRLTAKHEWTIIVSCSNVCDCNTRPWSIIIARTDVSWFQLKVEEAKFNDVSVGNCDIPCTPTVLRVVIWKIGACNESS